MEVIKGVKEVSTAAAAKQAKEAATFQDRTMLHLPASQVRVRGYEGCRRCNCSIDQSTIVFEGARRLEHKGTTSCRSAQVHHRMQHGIVSILLLICLVHLETSVPSSSSVAFV